MMIINVILFNAMWFGCIYWGNVFVPLVLMWAFFHFTLSQNAREEMSFVFMVTLLGTVIDSALIHLGVFIFSSDQYVIPLWLIAIWLSFSLTLNSSLSFLKRSLILQYVIGAVAPPLSYLAGSKLGGVTFGYSHTVSLITLSVIWLCLLPFLFKLNKRFSVVGEQNA